MRLAITCFIVVLVLSVSSFAQNTDQQITTTSWHGLSGLYVIPTARMIGKGNFAIGFNESKHDEVILNGLYVDRQIRGVATYGVTDWLEVYAAFWNDMITTPPNASVQMNNETFNSFGFKVKLRDEDPHYWFPEVSLAVRDIFDTTADVGPLKDVNNGTKGFILASKRMLKDEKTGRCHGCARWAHFRP